MKASKTLPVAEARSQLADLLNEVAYGGQSVIVTRRGKPLAAIVSPRLLKRFEEMQDELDAIQARKALQENGRYSLSDIKRELNLETDTNGTNEVRSAVHSGSTASTEEDQ